MREELRRASVGLLETRIADLAEHRKVAHDWSKRSNHRCPQDPTRHRITSLQLLNDANKLSQFGGYEKGGVQDGYWGPKRPLAAGVRSTVEEITGLEQRLERDAGTRIKFGGALLAVQD